MEYRVDPIPVHTDIIRTPAVGPKPANVFAFVQCRASGADIGIYQSDVIRFGIEFKSKFKIDGYLQSRHDWYLANTMVSATGMLRLINTTTDMEFLIALDTVEPFIELDGHLSFRCQLGLGIGGLGFLEKEAELIMVCNICAYVLLYEPLAELPPSGRSAQTWSTDPPERAPETSRSLRHIKRLGEESRLSLDIAPRTTKCE